MNGCREIHRQMRNIRAFTGEGGTPSPNARAGREVQVERSSTLGKTVIPAPLSSQEVALHQ